MRVNIAFIKILLLIPFLLIGGCKKKIEEGECTFKNISLGESIFSLKRKFKVRYDSSIRAYVVDIPSDSMFRSDVVVYYEKKGFFKEKVVKRVSWAFNYSVTPGKALQFCKNKFGDYVEVEEGLFEFRKERHVFSLVNFRSEDNPERELLLVLEYPKKKIDIGRYWWSG